MALDRTYVLKWTLPEGPPADGFVVHLGTEPGHHTETLELGFVAPGSDGIWRSNLSLDAYTTYHLVLVAYNAEGNSPPSEEGMVPAMACDASLCDDDNACTADACDATGCTNTILSDGAGCPDGMCLAGACEAVGCSADTECNDGNSCNGAERCGPGGLCLAGEPLACDEVTACTAPACDPLWGCTTVNVPDRTRCDDGNRTTRSDSCLDGVCVGTERRGHGRGHNR
jgi:hypothetical protein